MENAHNFQFLENYILVEHSREFVVTSQNVTTFWIALSAFCKKNNCSKVVSDGNLIKRKMTLVEAFEAGDAAGQNIIGVWFACVLTEFEPDETTDFFKTVAVNRGVRIEFFKNRDEALEWLEVL